MNLQPPRKHKTPAVVRKWVIPQKAQSAWGNSSLVFFAVHQIPSHKQSLTRPQTIDKPRYKQLTI